MKVCADDAIDIERIATSGTEQHGASKEIRVEENAGFHRSLTRRKVMMMTFGAGIGTGLWVGTGQALYYGMSSTRRLMVSMLIFVSWSWWHRLDVYFDCVSKSAMLSTKMLIKVMLELSSTPSTAQLAR